MSKTVFKLHNNVMHVSERDFLKECIEKSTSKTKEQ
jgi:hypothetical protein